jgi:hypothetical protein
VDVDKVDAPDLPIAVEHIIVFVLPFPGDAGGAGATEEEGGHAPQYRGAVLIRTLAIGT